MLVETVSYWQPKVGNKALFLSLAKRYLGANMRTIVSHRRTVLLMLIGLVELKVSFQFNIIEAYKVLGQKLLLRSLMWRLYQI